MVSIRLKKPDVGFQTEDHVSQRAKRLRGAAAITEMLDLIGAHDVSDHDVSKVLVEHELDIRELLSFALFELAS